MKEALVLPKDLEAEVAAVLASLEALTQHLAQRGFFGSARLTQLACNHVRDVSDLYKEEE